MYLIVVSFSILIIITVKNLMLFNVKKNAKGVVSIYMELNALGYKQTKALNYKRLVIEMLVG